MTKERLLEAIKAAADGEDIGKFHDEFETIIALVHLATEPIIAAAKAYICENED